MGKDEGKGIQDLEKKAKNLEKREEDLKAREKHLDELQTYVDDKEKALTEREKMLPSVIDTGPQKPKPLSKAEQKLIEDGCKAYGIQEKHLFSFGIDPLTKEAVLVTKGGQKRRYKQGDEVDKLNHGQITGDIPESKKAKKPIMGKK